MNESVVYDKRQDASEEFGDRQKIAEHLIRDPIPSQSSPQTRNERTGYARGRGRSNDPNYFIPTNNKTQKPPPFVFRPRITPAATEFTRHCPNLPLKVYLRCILCLRFTSRHFAHIAQRHALSSSVKTTETLDRVFLPFSDLLSGGAAAAANRGISRINGTTDIIPDSSSSR